MERDEEIREIAYRIWQQEGFPAGCEVKHWLRAEVLWEQEHRQKAKSRPPKVPKKTKTRKAVTVEP